MKNISGGYWKSQQSWDYPDQYPNKNEVSGFTEYLLATLAQSQLLHGEYGWELLIAAVLLDHLKILKELCTPGVILKPTKKNQLTKLSATKKKLWCREAVQWGVLICVCVIS